MSKISKYSKYLESQRYFKDIDNPLDRVKYVPFIIETEGVIHPEANEIIKRIAKLKSIKNDTNEDDEYIKIRNRILAVLKSRNMLSIMTHYRI